MESSEVIDAETKPTLETKLKSWSATSAEKIKSAGTKREYKFSTLPDWDCIVCDNPIKSNAVYQCQTGHLACNTCSQSGNNCRECSKAVSRIKNLAVETVVNSLAVTCKFTKLGCKEVMNYRDLKHEENCTFAPMVCPMPSCSQAGVKNLLAQHLLSEHKISLTVDVVQQGRYSYGYTGKSKEFELDSLTTSVMVRHMHSKEFHLLRQESTTVEDRLQITSLTQSCKRKYELVVTIGEEQAYCLQSVSTSNMQQGGQVLIPKQPGDGTLKKRCTIYMEL